MKQHKEEKAVPVLGAQPGDRLDSSAAARPGGQNPPTEAEAHGADGHPPSPRSTDVGEGSLCAYPACRHPPANISEARIDGKPYCLKHHAIVLERKANEHLALLPQGDFSGKFWQKNLYWIVRWAEAGADLPDGLTRGKIRNRGEDWRREGARIAFSIERHPAGLVTRQRWAFDTAAKTWQKLGEERIACAVALTEEGVPKCPMCGCGMVSTPGRLICDNDMCGFALLHEHSTF
jgi:hypothetical protein